MYKAVSRTALLVLAISLVLTSGSTRLLAGGQALSMADAKNWMGDWVLTIQGGRGPQERPLTIKDMGGKVVATLGGGRGGPIEVTDISKSGADVVLKFKQQGRGGEVEVGMTLSMQADGTLKVTQEAGGNKTEGTGKKKA